MRNIDRENNIDVNANNYSPIATFKQGDNATLELTLFKNGQEFDITGQTVTLGAYRPNNTVVEQIDGFTINRNLLTIKLKNSILAIHGIVEIELNLEDSEGEMTTSNFFIKVNKKILGEDNLAASDEFNSLKQLKIDLQNAKENEDIRIKNEKDRVAAEITREERNKEISLKCTKMADDYNKALANVTNGNESATNSEIVQARGKSVNLGARLDGIDSQLSEKANEIDVYNKDVVDNKVWNMANMGQDVKEAMTNGSVAVVGKNAVLTENIVNKQVTYEKTSFMELDKKYNLFDGNYIYGSIDGSIPNFTWSPESNNYKTAIVKIKPNTKYSIIRSKNSDRFKIATDTQVRDLSDRFSFDGSIKVFPETYNYTFTSGQNDTTLYIYVASQNQNVFLQVVEGEQSEFTIDEYMYNLKGLSLNGNKNFENVKFLGNKLSSNNSYICFPKDYKITINFEQKTGKLSTNLPIVLLKSREVANKDRTILIPKLNLTLPQYGVVYFDYTEAINAVLDSNGCIPLDLIKVTSYYQGFDTNRHIALFWTDREIKQIGTSTGLEVNVLGEKVSHNKILVDKQGNTINIYVPSKKYNGKYIRYKYLRDVDSSKNNDVWRTMYCDVVIKNIDGSFTTEYNFGDPDIEWEGAIKEVGKPDFIGGWHGDETFQDLSVVIDNKEYDMTTNFTVECDYINCTEKSKVFHCETADLAFTRYKINEWNLNEFKIYGKWICESSFNIQESKLSMMSIQRTTQSGEQYFNWARYDYDYEKTNVSQHGYSGGVTIRRKDVKMFETWGDKIYVKFICDYKDKEKYPNRSQYMMDFANNRNKIYFDLTGSYQMEKGEILEYTTTIIINI